MSAIEIVKSKSFLPSDCWKKLLSNLATNTEEGCQRKIHGRVGTKKSPAVSRSTWPRKFKSLGFKTLRGKKKYKLRDLIEPNLRRFFIHYNPILILFKMAFLEFHDQM